MPTFPTLFTSNTPVSDVTQNAVDIFHSVFPVLAPILGASIAFFILWGIIHLIRKAGGYE